MGGVSLNDSGDSIAEQTFEGVKLSFLHERVIVSTAMVKICVVNGHKPFTNTLAYHRQLAYHMLLCIWWVESGGKLQNVL